MGMPLLISGTEAIKMQKMLIAKPLNSLFTKKIIFYHKKKKTCVNVVFFSKKRSLLKGFFPIQKCSFFVTVNLPDELLTLRIMCPVTSDEKNHLNCCNF